MFLSAFRISSQDRFLRLTGLEGTNFYLFLIIKFILIIENLENIFITSVKYKSHACLVIPEPKDDYS